MPLNVVIIEDEPFCQEDLIQQLADLPIDIQVIGTADNVAAGAELIRRSQPQLVFLDVEIKDRLGFELFSYLPDVDFDVIFTTGHSKYALQAIKVSALDFLLKPIDPDELHAAITKKEIKDEYLRQKLETLQINVEKQQLKRIAIPTLHGLEFIQLENMLYCQAEDNYSRIVMEDRQEHLVSRTLKKLEDLLDPSSFCRINRSTVINLNHLKSFNRGKTATVTVDGDHVFNLSPNRKEAFLNRIQQL